MYSIELYFNLLLFVRYNFLGMFDKKFDCYLRRNAVFIKILRALHPECRIYLTISTYAFFKIIPRLKIMSYIDKQYTRVQRHIVQETFKIITCANMISDAWNLAVHDNSKAVL